MRHHPIQAATSMVGAMAIIGLIDNYIAVIARDISLWQFQFLRWSMGAPILLILAAAGLASIRPKRLWAVLVRNGLVALGMLFYFGSLAFMPIAQALAGLFVAPIFVLLISVFAFGEKVGPLRIVAVIAGFVGVIIVPLIALAIIGPEAPEGRDGFLLRGWTWPEAQTWWLIAVQAVGSLAGVGLLIRAYQSAEPSFVAVFEYSVFIFGPFFAFLLFGETITLMQVFGIVLIAAAGSLIALRSGS